MIGDFRELPEEAPTIATAALARILDVLIEIGRDQLERVQEVGHAVYAECHKVYHLGEDHHLHRFCPVSPVSQWEIRRGLKNAPRALSGHHACPHDSNHKSWRVPLTGNG